MLDIVPYHKAKSLKIKLTSNGIILLLDSYWTLIGLLLDSRLCKSLADAFLFHAVIEPPTTHGFPRSCQILLPPRKWLSMTRNHLSKSSQNMPMPHATNSFNYPADMFRISFRISEYHTQYISILFKRVFHPCQSSPAGSARHLFECPLGSTDRRTSDGSNRYPAEYTGKTSGNLVASMMIMMLIHMIHRCEKTCGVRYVGYQIHPNSRLTHTHTHTHRLSNILPGHQRWQARPREFQA
jgi:hypothetical protein